MSKTEYKNNFAGLTEETVNGYISSLSSKRSEMVAEKKRMEKIVNAMRKNAKGRQEAFDRIDFANTKIVGIESEIHELDKLDVLQFVEIEEHISELMNERQAMISSKIHSGLRFYHCYGNSDY